MKDLAEKILLTIIGSGYCGEPKELAKQSYDIADAMQAEVDERINKERINKERPDVWEDVKREGEYFYNLLLRSYRVNEEWQPDWSQAPEWANWWAMDGFSKKANWYIDKPYLDDDSDVESEWNIDLKANTETYMEALSFGYQGDWKDSLRKRP